MRDWEIEGFVLGELPPAEQEALARAVGEDPALRARVAAIEASNRAILAAHPARVAASVIRERFAPGPLPVPWSRRLAFAAAASLAVVGAGLGLLRMREARVEVPAETRIKGLQPHLEIFRQTPAGIEPLAEGADGPRGRPGAAHLPGGGTRASASSSRSTGGAPSPVHHPRESRQAARLEPGEAARLSSAYRLDDAPGWERFVLVTAERPFEVAPVVEAAARLGRTGAAGTEPLALPSPLEQSSFTLRKDDRR